jgi:hypothetical protein
MEGEDRLDVVRAVLRANPRAYKEKQAGDAVRTSEHLRISHAIRYRCLQDQTLASLLYDLSA